MIDASESALFQYIQTDFEYNSAGLLIQLTYSDADLIDANNTEGITEQYAVEYDGRGYIVGEQLVLDYSTTEAMTTLYKAYEYDSIGRLVKAARGDNQETVWSNWDHLTEYTYDRIGNRLSMDDGTDTYAYSYTQFNQLEEVAKNSSTFETCEYDLLGNQTVKYAEYSSGNPTVAVVYSYDLRNQLKDVGTTTDVTGLTNVTTINENIYNANGQRISKSEDSATEKYFYSGSALIYTKSGSGRMMTENILDLSGNIIASTRFDDDGDENTPNQWEGKYFFYHYDIRGSVTAIVDPDGNSVKAYAYDEFGNLSESGEATFDNEVTFTGSIKDTSTGLQYMNARYYEPTTGRFITQDSYTGNPYDPWTQHLYSYCGNNAVNMIDPTGHKAMMIGGGPSLSRYQRFNSDLLITSMFTENPLISDDPDEIIGRSHVESKLETLISTFDSGVSLKTAIKGYAEYFVRPMIESAEENLSKLDGTLSKGISLAGSPTFWNYNVQIGQTFDFKGNVETQVTYGTGPIITSNPGGSIMGYLTTTNAPFAENLRGMGYQIGGSAGVPVLSAPLGAGYEFNMLQNEELDINGNININNYVGNTYLFGFSTPGVEGHVEFTYTKPYEQYSFNYYYVAYSILDFIKDW